MRRRHQKSENCTHKGSKSKEAPCENVQHSKEEEMGNHFAPLFPAIFSLSKTAFLSNCKRSELKIIQLTSYLSFQGENLIP